MVSRRALLTGLGAAGLILPRAARALLFVGGATAAQRQALGFYLLSDYGAAQNLVMLTGCSMSSSSSPTVLTAPGASFTSADNGKVVCVGGAGASGAPLVTTISSASGTSATLAASCLTTVTNAVVHYGTDDTTPFQNALNAAVTAGYGTVVVNKGVMINGALQNTSTHNAQLVLAKNAVTNPVVTISIVGQNGPSNNVNSGTPTDVHYPAATGSIVFSPLQPASGGTVPPCLFSPYSAGSGTDFTNVFLRIEGLFFRSAYLTPNPLRLINAQWTAFCEINNVVCDVDASASQQDPTQPTGTTTGATFSGVGITLPDVNNGAFVKMSDCFTTGYEYGAQLSEHATVANYTSQFCRAGVNVKNCYQAIYCDRLSIFRCKYPIYADGVTNQGATKCPLLISEYNTEHAPAGKWYTTTNDVLDASNVISGKMLGYVVNTSFVGYDQASFSKSGGTGFTCTALF